MDIYPSILEPTKQAFEEQFSRVLPYFNHFQIDIADGIFVPHKTVQLENLDFRIWNLEGKTFEFHLMVKDWEAEIKKLANLPTFIKVTTVLIHLQTLHRDSSVASLPRNDRWKCGLVLNPEDDVSENWETLKSVDTIQIMTILPGAQGNPFIPEVLTKLDQLHDRHYTGITILDGGINDTTLPQIMARPNWPNAVCPGSYFTEDVENRLKKLHSLNTDY